MSYPSKSIVIFLFLILTITLAIGCNDAKTPDAGPEPDPLPSWTEGPTRSAIVEFVRNVTTEGDPNYVPPEERIATFDNDGTLWCEQPVVQFAYIIYRIQQLAPQHPEWNGTQPFEAALKNDLDFLLNDYMSGGQALPQLFLVTHADMSLSDFNQAVSEFFAEATHPKYGVPYTQTIYQPMLELLQYLRANGFKTYICSGGGIDFMRVMAEDTYGVVPENVIGSNGRNIFKQIEGKWQLMKKADSIFKNDKEGKPEGIDLHIGRTPIFAAGNVRSGGDIAMLTYCQTNTLPSFQLMINHDDHEREFAYSEKDNASLNAAKENRWFVVNMKSDWKQIFSFQ